MGKPIQGRNRVVVEHVEPEVDCGRFPIKRIAGETVRVEADVFADGHDDVRARLLWKREDESRWQAVAMSPLGNDRWRGEFPTGQIGRYTYTVAGEIDRFGTWRNDLKKRIAAGQDLKIPLETGAVILKHAASLAKAEDARKLRKWAQALKRGSGGLDVAQVALEDEIAETVRLYPDLARESRYSRELGVVVDRERAGFSAWYELFPRSWSKTPGQHGTFNDVGDRLEYVAQMGFNVLYLPPVHPIGNSFRKGKNNNPEAQPGEVGSPWAIGSAEGGHTSIHPQLGATDDAMDDFLRLVERARECGLEIALDIAFQASPDHPWATTHPDFFKKRPDGSIQYAENPPKKYQDIYPLDFESAAWRDLWDELKAVFSFWIGKGVKIFRVDNPHTKAFPFWEWAISELKAEHPEVLLLAEAFTRPRVMERLAKLGFSQSYTYFTWRTTKEELTQYMRELTQTPIREYFRPNFWPNTPDILSEGLQTGGLPAFRSRLVLAATLAANYGIYGPAFELGENRPVMPGSEEYLNSEKYEIRQWDLDAPDSLKPLITTLNRARRDNPALQSNLSLHFHEIGNSSLLCYSKRSADGENTILVVVNLDPFHVQAGWTRLDLDALGLAPGIDDPGLEDPGVEGQGAPFEVHDLLADRSYSWRGARNYVELRPAEAAAHLFEVRKAIRTETQAGKYL
jgi:starch synthase (maltosyl-transferring)